MSGVGATKSSQATGGDLGRQPRNYFSIICYLVEMIGPALQRIPHFAGIFGAILDPSNAAFVTADMVEDSFDDVRLNA